MTTMHDIVIHTWYGPFLEDDEIIEALGSEYGVIIKPNPKAKVWGSPKNIIDDPSWNGRFDTRFIDYVLNHPDCGYKVEQFYGSRYLILDEDGWERLETPQTIVWSRI